MASKKLKKGQLVRTEWFVPGYPTGLCSDTYCRVKEIQKDRALLVRDDGRQGQWWVDVEAINRLD